MPPQQARCPFRTSGYVSSGSYGQGSLQIQPTIIQRPASDDAFDAVFDMQTQHANVADPGDATTGDHRYISRARQIDGRFDIAAFQESVRSEEHTSELQSLMRISYAVFCLTKKKQNNSHTQIDK